jgi:hypothetical protein
LGAAVSASPPDRVARWFIFKRKIPMWVNFGGPWSGKVWHILNPFEKILPPFGTF